VGTADQTARELADAPAAFRSARSRRRKVFGKIQSICNAKFDPDYNASPCAGERKASGASNGKNNKKQCAEPSKQ
jgi:hypothetical protein